MLQTSQIYEGIHPWREVIEPVLQQVNDGVPVFKDRKGIGYLNCPAAFDIETSSFYEGVEKKACMYIWMAGINGAVFYGRTWEEFVEMLHIIHHTLQLHRRKRLVMYVHNLAYEFQFMRKWLDWVNVFAVDDRKPVYALSEYGIEFRCSYILSGASLDTVGKNLAKYKVLKKSGDLDYSLIRHSHTPLDPDKEMGYCENDIRVVMSFIMEEIEGNEGHLPEIPLTKTGYVRRFCRRNTLVDGHGKKYQYQYNKYRKLMQALTLEPDEYKMLRRAFQGGFTHLNANYWGKVVKGPDSADFTSSYPAIPLSRKLPMSKGVKVNVKSSKEFQHYINNYCCVFDVEFTGLASSVTFEHYLSFSRCLLCTGYTLDNGRVVEAEHVITTITEQDYFIMRQVYSWKSIKVGAMYVYKKAYLPAPFLKSILELYQKKTELKGVVGQEVEYQLSKGMLNSCY